MYLKCIFNFHPFVLYGAGHDMQEKNSRLNRAHDLANRGNALVNRGNAIVIMCTFSNTEGMN